MNKIVFILLTVVLLTAVNTYSKNEIRIGGLNQTKFMVDSLFGTAPQRYLEEYAEFSFGYNWFDLDLAYSAYLPPFPSSYSSYGHGISRYALIFTKGDIMIKAGMFYELFGNGITLNAYQNRDLNWDNNINGFNFDYYSDILELKVIAGAPRNQYGERFKPVEGFDLRYFKGDIFQPGLTFVITEQSDTSDYVGSFYSKLFLPFAEISSEFSFENFVDKEFGTHLKKSFTSPEESLENGTAIYLNSSFFLGSLTLIAEGKYFNNYNLFENIKLNNTPPVIKEHLYALLNQKQPEFSGNNERGFQFDLSGPLGEKNTFLLNFSNSRKLSNKLIYQDIYGQVDFVLPTSKNLELHFAGGLQKDIDGKYLNFVINPDLSINSKYSINGEFVHQLSLIDNSVISGRKYFYQDYILSLVRAPGIILSALFSITSDPEYKKVANKFVTHNWLGFQIDWNFLKNNDLSLFVGCRKKGKVCAGGVCVQKPELNGIELILTSRF